MNDKVECQICGKSLRSVNGLHLRIHGITTAQYRTRFPNAPFHSLKTRKNISEGLEHVDISGNTKAAWRRGCFDKSVAARSRELRESWADPSSGFNTEQRRNRLSGSIKAAWQAGKYDSPEIRERMSKARVLAWSEGKFKDRKAARPDMCGPGNPNWNGGSSFELYPSTFDGIFKQMIRERDGNVCAICRLLEPGGNELSVHHIDYNKKNTTSGNCISLCNACHMVTNFNREYWQQELSRLASIREETWP